MTLRSYTVGLVPLAAMIVGFGMDTANATAQTTYEFSATYDTVAFIDPSYRPDLGIARTTVTGESNAAPYGLTYFTSDTYNRFDPTTNTSTFDADPSVFGLQGEPILGDRYYGSNNELYGTASDRATFDFEAGTVAGGGTITITGGKGIFENATGKITFTQNDTLTSTDLSEPFKGQATLNFSVQTPQAVPEPDTNATLIGMSLLGCGFLVRRSRRKTAI